MSKYIIKNCDCYGFGDACLSNNANQLYCKDITDCVIKRIAKICKAEKNKGFVMTRYGTKEPIGEGWDLACEILELLEIEECE